jgi:NDP-sugar pyrophosphorylase family protein
MIDTALILAAGLGTRLAPLSSLRAKAALPVAGEALIRRQIRWLAAAGVTRVVVNLHHRPATITAAVGHGDELGVAVSYSWEPTVLGSAGGPRRALDLIDRDRFLIVNGDTLTDLDLQALTTEHDRSGALVTMAAVAARPGYNAVRVVAGAFAGVIDAASVSAGETTGAHFIGVQVADRRTFADLSADAPADTVRGLYPRLVEAAPGAVRVQTTAATFHDVGTPADYLRTVRHIAHAEGRPLDRGAGTAIAATARVESTVCWNDVVIGEGAEVIGCVVGDAARVPDGLQVRDSCLLPAAGYVVRPGDRVFGDLVVVPFVPPGVAPG